MLEEKKIVSPRTEVMKRNVLMSLEELKSNKII
jgi:hypothetical protein